MKPTHQVLFVAGLLGLAAITWGLLTRSKPPADWLRIKAPSQITLGETITIRVTLSPGLDSNLLLAVDLHGSTHRQHPLRTVSTSRPQRVGLPAESKDFRLTVPDRPDLATVKAIIYLSPTGDWLDRVRQVQSDPIPVNTGPQTGSELQPLPVHDDIPDPEIPRRELTKLRYMIAALWLLVAGGLILRNKLSEQTNPAAAHPRYGWFILACLLIASAELLRIEPFLSDAVRKLAITFDRYNERLLSQQIITMLLVVGMSAVSGIIYLRARLRRVALGQLAHATIVAGAVISLHDGDALLYASPLGVPVEQLLKLAAVTLALWGLRPRFTAGTAPSSA